MRPNMQRAPDFPVLGGDVVGGRYRVDRPLGHGGMGVVVAATHVELQRPVALKFLAPELVDGPLTERFLREARVVGQLRSEHVARVFDFGFHRERYPYMVLELLEGKDLAQLEREKGSLPVPEAVDYVVQALRGLAEAHAAGIVHRDLKPDNIFVTKRVNGSTLVKLLDFGIAKTTSDTEGDRSLTLASAVMGSPFYMAPEQMRSARLADARSDIWSMGVILYQLLAGQLPFDGESVMDIGIAVSTLAPRRLLSLRPALDPALAAVVMRCLEKDPARRWQSVPELVKVLAVHGRSHRGPRSGTIPLVAAPSDVRRAPRPGFAKGVFVGVCITVVALCASAYVARRMPAAQNLDAPPREPPTLTSATLPLSPAR